ncbi:MAG: sodium:alanine symporter family protein [Gammaproteobacteria bacterium]|nr:sodium:alanine symporter family protein [Gammaproteobacteria bacterium]MYF37638.1 sodium:alanine symporter family protein [Gammaproteobacteria bacterium]
MQTLIDNFLQGFGGFLDALDGLLGGHPWFAFALLGVGIWFTIYLGLPQLRYFPRAWRILAGKETPADSPGDTTHFQALSTALSGTVGTGNIAGVALAIFVGGPAAIFWMWATAFIGMTTKFVEVTLSHKYRVTDEKGEMAGGPMYFMERRLNMKWLAVLFAIATIFTTLGVGNLPQSSSLAAGLETSFSIPPWVTGIVLATVLGLIIIGGIKRIATFASSVVPFMGMVYVIGALTVILTNYDQILPSLGSIFSYVFSGSAALGGFLGASFAFAFTKGVGRGLFSNEAGLGSAPIAHASARGESPVAEGLVSLLEPFIDTLVICTLTALVILSSGVWTKKFENEFEFTSIQIVQGVYEEGNQEHTKSLAKHLAAPSGGWVERFEGTLNVVDGVIQETDITVIHNRSIAEEIRVYSHDANEGKQLHTGTIQINENGQLPSGVSMVGKSLIHSVPLTSEAFRSSLFGDFGPHIVSITLVFFAFTTAVAWSYYGDRAVVYLFGVQFLLPYRIAYTLMFLIAALLDTGLVWKISAVTLFFMALPNLFGITLLSKEMKTTTKEFFNRSP